MKTLSFTSKGRYFSHPVLVDFDKHTVENINGLSSYIDNIYVAPEDIEIRYKNNGKLVVLSANKGDIIVTFYKDETTKNPIIVVKNADWKANVIEMIKDKERRKSDELVEASFMDCKESCGCCICQA